MIVPEPRHAGRKHLTMEEWRAVIVCARGQGLFEHTLMRVMYECGLRASEPGAMVLDHVKRLDRKQLYVPRGKGSVTGWQDISKGLSGLLWEWVCDVYGLPEDELSPRQAAEQWPEAFVFPGKRYRGSIRPLSRKQVWRVVRRLMERADVDPQVCYPHAIKHSRVQHLFEEAERQGLPAEVALKTVANIVGHKSAQTSWQHYVAQTGAGKAVADTVLKAALEEDE